MQDRHVQGLVNARYPSVVALQTVGQTPTDTHSQPGLRPPGLQPGLAGVYARVFVFRLAMADGS